MAKLNPMSVLYGFQKSKVSPIDFMFDQLSAPPMLSLITLQDIATLNYIATSLKYSGNIEKKYNAMDAVLYPRGFKKLSTGTNRRAYIHPEYPIVLKVGLESVGISDSPREYKNQFLLKPFCTKIFEVSPCGTVALVERVNPITSKAEFLSVAEDIFYLINKKIIGKYVLEDIGTKFFMNWGLRENGFGPVLLDFPYVYELDGSKLICNALIPQNNFLPCGGSVDYDNGFNKLICTKCGREYSAREISQPAKEGHSNIIFERDINEEELPMIVTIKKNGEVIKETERESDRIIIPESQQRPQKTESDIRLRKNEELVQLTHDEKLGTVIIKKRPKKNNKNNQNRNNQHKNNNNQSNNSKGGLYDSRYDHGTVRVDLKHTVVADDNDKVQDVQLPQEESHGTFVVDIEKHTATLKSEDSSTELENREGVSLDEKYEVEPDHKLGESEAVKELENKEGISLDESSGNYTSENDSDEEYVSKELNIKDSDFDEPTDEDDQEKKDEYEEKYKHLIPDDDTTYEKIGNGKAKKDDYY